MKNFVQAWELHREHVRDVMSRLVILLLPWQTRYFIPGMTLGGYPWEQGRWSLYASMLGIMLVVALSWREIYSS
ncbi:hypothetical protein KBB27_03400, partial [Patescibacteria group bacterium]|nr:hypothetical protein [Patescibacteria group bacterium]